MIEKISDKILTFLVNNDAVKDDMYDIYHYGVEITIASICNILLILAIGLALKCFAASVIFLLCFIPIRLYCGGYHADTYLKCNLTFGASFLITGILYKLTASHINIIAAAVILLISVAVLLRYSPIENENKPLDDEQKRRCRLISIIIWCMEAEIAANSVILGFTQGVMALYSLALVAVFMIVEILLTRRNEK